MKPISSYLLTPKSSFEFYKKYPFPYFQHKDYGVIRAEVKKPENIPNYKVPLRDNYKIKIGRSEECHIRIDLPSIADKHAEIYYRNEIFSYKDCSRVNLGSWKRLS